MSADTVRPALFDCDTGIDDALALLHLAGRGGRLLGVTSVHGNVPAAVAAGVAALQIVQMAQRFPREFTLVAVGPLTNVALDATMQTVRPDSHLRTLASPTDPKARFAWAALGFYLDAYERWSVRRSCPLHDPLAVALALQPDLATYRSAHTSVELHGIATRGALVPDLRGSTERPAAPGGDVTYIDELDVEQFHALFIASLTSAGPV